MLLVLRVLWHAGCSYPSADFCIFPPSDAKFPKSHPPRLVRFGTFLGGSKFMFKKVLLLAVLALALPMAAFASGGVDFTNVGGTLSGNASGLSLSGSTLALVNGLYGGGLIVGSNLGSVSFSTGALTSGDLQMGG